MSPRRADGSRPLFGARGVKRRDGREFDFVDKKRDGREDDNTRERHALTSNKDRSYMRTCREEMPLFGSRGDAVREADEREARQSKDASIKTTMLATELVLRKGRSMEALKRRRGMRYLQWLILIGPNQGSRNASINGEDKRDRRRVGEPLASADMGPP